MCFSLGVVASRPRHGFVEHRQSLSDRRGGVRLRLAHERQPSRSQAAHESSSGQMARFGERSAFKEVLIVCYTISQLQIYLLKRIISFTISSPTAEGLEIVSEIV